jgi:hypothetical protein
VSGTTKSGRLLTQRSLTAKGEKFFYNSDNKKIFSTAGVSQGAHRYSQVDPKGEPLGATPRGTPPEGKPPWGEWGVKLVGFPGGSKLVGKGGVSAGGSKPGGFNRYINWFEICQKRGKPTVFLPEKRAKKMVPPF